MIMSLSKDDAEFLADVVVDLVSHQAMRELIDRLGNTDSDGRALVRILSCAIAYSNTVLMARERAGMREPWEQT